MERLVIGIAGGTGSGKTTVAEKLLKAYSPNAVLLSHDYYYKNNYHLSYEERVAQNYDHPNAFDTDMMIDHVKMLKRGMSIQHPTYNFKIHLRNEQTKTLDSAKIIIVEGILIFQCKELCDLIDIKLYVDTDADVRFIRRLLRDVQERGRTMESVVNQYLKTVKPMHEQFVEPSKRMADIIIPEGGHNVVAIEMIIDAIKKRIATDEPLQSL
ncbi:MAG: uridine kinase [Clostridia bacterium]|nr:uridine kinase [Clostridia bacterium]